MIWPSLSFLVQRKNYLTRGRVFEEINLASLSNVVTKQFLNSQVYVFNILLLACIPLFQGIMLFNEDVKQATFSKSTHCMYSMRIVLPSGCKIDKTTHKTSIKARIFKWLTFIMMKLKIQRRMTIKRFRISQAAHVDEILFLLLTYKYPSCRGCHFETQEICQVAQVLRK